MSKTKYSEHSPTICRQFSEKNIFHEIRPKSFSVDFQIFRKLSQNSPRIFRKIIAHKFYQKHFPEFYNFPKSYENFETIFVDVRFQFCLAAESIWQDGAILPDDQRQAGQDEWLYNKKVMIPLGEKPVTSTD